MLSYLQTTVFHIHYLLLFVLYNIINCLFIFLSSWTILLGHNKNVFKNKQKNSKYRISYTSQAKFNHFNEYLTQIFSSLRKLVIAINVCKLQHIKYDLKNTAVIIKHYLQKVPEQMVYNFVSIHFVYGQWSHIIYYTIQYILYNV